MNNSSYGFSGTGVNGIANYESLSGGGRRKARRGKRKTARRSARRSARRPARRAARWTAAAQPAAAHRPAARPRTCGRQGRPGGALHTHGEGVGIDARRDDELARGRPQDGHLRRQAAGRWNQRRRHDHVRPALAWHAHRFLDD